MSALGSQDRAFFNRELSWLEFNRRVLDQALDGRRPLLERLKFVAIVSSNLDEFFMVRVAGLKRQLRSQTLQRSPDGMTAADQLAGISERCRAMVAEQYACLNDEVLPQLAERGIIRRRFEELDGEQLAWCDSLFHKRIFPVLTPLALDPGHPFPHLRNQSLNLAVKLAPRRLLHTVADLAVVQVPLVLPRIVHLSSVREQYEFVFLEDIIAHGVPDLFQGMEVLSCAPFRVTRDSDLNFDEDEAEDLLETIEQELRRREWGDAVRLEVHSRCDETVLARLCGDLHVADQDTYSVDGPLNLVDLWQLYHECDAAELRDEPFVPAVAPALRGRDDIFSAIRERDILLHHPYEAFSSVVDFVKQAAEDPDVLAIKQTLYRTSGDSPIVRALARAAENGKQVTALVELKARFDEQNNIVWARELEEAGVHVVYGLIGLKTHCKVLLVVRQEADRVRRYVHLGTGNYHPATAKLYTDLGLLTCRLPYGQDVSRLFNVLTGYSEFPKWRRLLVAPLGMREAMIALVQREAEVSTAAQPGRIICKMNSLVDPDSIEALYRASTAGVQVDLIVRGVCCLRPGVPGRSENIRVRSIVGRFLEHSRIFYFANAGQPEVFVGSADWMQRNFSGRVEAIFPVEAPELRDRLLYEVLAASLADTAQAYDLLPDGSYRRVERNLGAEPFDSQAWLLERAHSPDVMPLPADVLAWDRGAKPTRQRARAAGA